MTKLNRIRWGVRAVLLLGVIASVIANVLHALDNPISQAIAAWPPLALLLTIELISRVPVHGWKLAAARLVATAVIASIAAWVSYWHMVGVALRYGETSSAAHMIPLSVDGLIVVASICLVELSGRIAQAATGVELAHPEQPQTAAAVPVLDETPAAVTAPAEPPATADPGSPQPDEPAVQKMRQDPRSVQEIEDAVRAIWEARPNLSQRKIAQIAGTSPTTAGRIIREAKAAKIDQTDTASPAPDPAAAVVEETRELADVTA